MIVLFPTLRDLVTEATKGPTIIVERFVRADASIVFFTSVYANGRALDRKEHDTLDKAIDAAVERDRQGVRMKRPASFVPQDPTREAIDMGATAPGVESPPPAPPEQEDDDGPR